MTIVVTYDADPYHYGTDDIDEMAAIDRDNVINYPEHAGELLCNHDFTVDVKVENT